MTIHTISTRDPGVFICSCGTRYPFDLSDEPTAVSNREAAWRLAEAHVDRFNAEQVHHPNHYGGDTTYETIKVIAAWGLGFLLGNCVKYLSRAGKKDPAKILEDLQKGRWYLDQAIEQLKAGKPLY